MSTSFTHLNTPNPTLRPAVRGLRTELAEPAIEGRLRRIILFLTALFEEEVNQLGRRVVHFNYEVVHLAGEVVEQPDCGHRHGETDRRGDERFRDTAGHRRDTSISRFAHSHEGVDDSKNRAEQPHEWGGRADRRQAGEAAPEFGDLDRRGAL